MFSKPRLMTTRNRKRRVNVLSANDTMITDSAKIAQRRFLLLKRVLSTVNVEFEQPFRISDLLYRAVSRETLIDAYNVQRLQTLKPLLKTVFSTDKLTCLHNDSVQKQKQPGINMIRQLLKLFDLTLKPNTVTIGYEKQTGAKISRRFFTIVPFHNFSC